MVAKKNKKPAKKVKSLPAKSVSARQARTVKGGDKATFHELNVTHPIDKSTPIFFSK